VKAEDAIAHAKEVEGFVARLESHATADKHMTHGRALRLERAALEGRNYAMSLRRIASELP